jgi:hypothetical protein
MAGGLGWGIRGQYGHETGAMIAGLLVSLVITHFFCRHWKSLAVARAVGLCTVAIGFGGAMTYGQTIGLTQDAPLVGNWAALRWGMLGLGIKGAVWIGFAGLFLGIGLGGVRYRPLELTGVLLAALGLFFAGVETIHSPFDPAAQILPPIYFSDDWRWEPGANLRPRREVWGGLWLALIGATAYARMIRRDRLALRLALWGMISGAIGFPAGQGVQAFHAWNREWFASGAWASIDPVINWWNMMETTFGAVLGGLLALGVWVHRKLLAEQGPAATGSLSPALEWPLAVIHSGLLLASEFGSLPVMGAYTEFSLIMGIIPLAAIAGGRWWPYLMIFPITLLPIAGKTVRQLGYREPALPEAAAWILYLALPLVLAASAVWWFGRGERPRDPASRFTGPALLMVTWAYFLLNFAFFRFPWPWERWTPRTPNGLIFLVCALGLTYWAWRSSGQRSDRRVTQSTPEVR